jgi:aspartyl-tRNA(Asn)/glutamyl-tRNA(Gln) amidotransferase subunit A
MSASRGSAAASVLAELRAGRVTSSELVDAYLARIDAVDTEIRAFVTVTGDEARVLAEKSDAERESGRSVGPLHGLPVALKDNIATAGVRTTMGSSFFSEHVPEQDAPVWSRMREAGAVLLGKTQLHEFAYGATTQNPHHGACRNPWNTDRTPGGSSGGSGAAAGADLCAVALGTDTGGSVRIPASLNGASGIRPTLGRVSNSGVFHVSWSFDTVGPLARSLADLAEVFDVMAGYDPADPMSVNRQAAGLVDGLDRGAEGIRIGIPSSFFFDDVDSDIASAVRAAADELSAAGLSVELIDVPGAEDAVETCSRVIWAEATAIHADRMEHNPDGFGDDVRKRLAFGHKVSGPEYAQCMESARRWRRTLEGVFESVDVILSPMNCVVAPLADAEMIETTKRLTRLTYGWSLAGLPAISIPCGLSADGLPIGLQLAAAPWRETELISVAATYQDRTSWHEALPPLPSL